jgi:hypothetical protein
VLSNQTTCSCYHCGRIARCSQHSRRLAGAKLQLSRRSQASQKKRETRLRGAIVVAIVFIASRRKCIFHSPFFSEETTINGERLDIDQMERADDRGQTLSFDQDFVRWTKIRSECLSNYGTAFNVPRKRRQLRCEIRPRSFCSWSIAIRLGPRTGGPSSRRQYMQPDGEEDRMRSLAHPVPLLLPIKLQLGARIRNESVPVRHFDLRQGLGIDRLARLDDLALRQDVGDHAIDLVVVE